MPFNRSFADSNSQQSQSAPSLAAQPTIEVDQNFLALALVPVGDILRLVVEHDHRHRALIVYDTQSSLAQILAEAYRCHLPDSPALDFYATAPEDILAGFANLSKSDLVILIQSSNFRMDAFRLRVKLFARQLKVIEHLHLERMTAEAIPAYIESLTYDPEYFRGVGAALKNRIDVVSEAVVDSGGAYLRFPSGLEPAKLNVGDYRGMKNIGGQFPIGEVFTEARDLESVSGRTRIFAFADRAFQVNGPPEPITLIIEKGRVVAVENSTTEFDRVLENIRVDEGEVWVRELGFGLNRAFTRERRVNDIGTYERMCGIHLSLGAKHAVFNKPDFRRKETKHHVDVFVITEAVYLDQESVFQNGAWRV